MKSKIPFIIKKSNKNKPETAVPPIIYKFLCALYNKDYTKEEELVLFHFPDWIFRIFQVFNFIVDFLKKIKLTYLVIIIIFGIIYWLIKTLIF